MKPTNPTIEKIRRLRHREEDRGAIGVMLALGMTVLLGSAALAIDLGHLMNVRTESQRVADLAALAGAGAFISAPGPNVATTADQWAKDFAIQNTVNRTSVALLSSDIAVDVPNEEVRVTVYNTQARGNAISTIFARVLGINQVDVVTTAVAKAWPSAGVTCMLPFFLPDRWDENGGSPNLYDDPPDYYEIYDYNRPTLTATGYSTDDVGLELILKPAQPSQSAIPRPNPSWWYPIRTYSGQGGAVYRDAISTCLDPNWVLSIGDAVNAEPGGMLGPTAQGFADLIAQDPSAVWDHDPAVNCIVDASNLGSGDASNCRGSARLRPVPLMAPYDAPPPGTNVDIPVSGFAGVFVDRVEGNNVYVIFAGFSGAVPAAGGGTGGIASPLPKQLRIIE